MNFQLSISFQNLANSVLKSSVAMDVENLKTINWEQNNAVCVHVSINKRWFINICFIIQSVMTHNS